MVDVAQLSIKVDTTDLARGEAALESFQQEGARTEKSVDGIGRASERAGRRSAGFGKNLAAQAGAQRRAGLAAQNAAFQIGDFATQIASGQRASVALAQQLPQLLGGFGLLGAAMGAVVAIGGALIPMFYNGATGADSFDDALEDLGDTIDRLRQPMKVLQLEADELAETFLDASQQILRAARFQAELEVSQAASRLAAEIDILNSSLTLFRETGARGSEFANLAKEMGLTAHQAGALQRAILEIGKATSFDEQTAALGNVIDKMEEYNVDLDKVPEELRRAISELITLQRETERAEAVMRKLGAEAAGVTIGVPLFSQQLDSLLPPTQAEDEKPRLGRARADTFAADLERLRLSLRTEREVVEEWFAESEALLNDHRARKELGEAEHKEAMLRLEEEYHNRVRGIRNKEQGATLADAANFFGAMEKAFSQGSDNLVKVARVAGGIEATINAYRAAAQALADPSVPFWGKAAAYASVLATGLGAVSAIRGAGAGGGGTAAVPPAAQPQNTSPRVALQLIGSESSTFTASQVRELINQINEATEDGAIVRLV